MKKKIAFILTVYVDGTKTIIEGSELEKESGHVANADTTDSIDEGGETPTKPPGSPQ